MLRRLVESVATHNRLAECDEMWSKHRQQQERGEASTSAAAETSNTPASLIEARREAEARKLARLAGVPAPGEAGRGDTEQERSAKRKRSKEEKREKKAKKKAKKEKKRSDKRERKREKKRKRAEDRERSAERSSSESSSDRDD